MAIRIFQFELGPMQNFAYVAACEQTGFAAIIDPAWEAEAYLTLLQQERLTPSQIWLTHSHDDHVNALSAIQAQLPQLPILMSAEEAHSWADCPGIGVKYISDEEVWSLGRQDVRAMLLPGHSPGSIAFISGDDCLVGDVLFSYGCGHCLMPGADPTQLYRSLQRMKILPDALRIWPGHNYGVEPVLSMREQRQGNPFLHCRDETEFVNYRMKVHGQTRTMPFAPISSETFDARIRQQLQDEP